jgi:ABC-type transporter Mla MlaB component
MPFSLTNREGRQTLTLAGNVTVRDASKLALLLNQGLEAGRPLEVQTAQLEDIDTCILQLLCSLKKTAPELNFVDTPEIFLDALDRSQLRRALLGSRFGDGAL